MSAEGHCCSRFLPCTHMKQSAAFHPQNIQTCSEVQAAYDACTLGHSAAQQHAAICQRAPSFGRQLLCVRLVCGKQ